MRKVLILASGGLDSTVVIALYKSLGYDVNLLYLPYGNINKDAETDKLVKLMTKFSIPEEQSYVIPLNLNYSSSRCIDEGDGATYVEMRNLIFISYAISMAEAKGIDEVAVGFIKTLDEYKDTTEEFVVMMNNLSVSTTGIEVKAPLKHLDKQGVYELGEKLGVSLIDVFSCNTPNGDKPCGECYDCVDTKQLIRQCNIMNNDNPFKN